MASLTYIQNRKTYTRPQGVLFANEPGLLSGGFYVPQGNEFGEYTSETT